MLVLDPAVTRILRKKFTTMCHFQTKKLNFLRRLSTPNPKMTLRLRVQPRSENPGYAYKLISAKNMTTVDQYYTYA